MKKAIYILGLVFLISPLAVLSQSEVRPLLDDLAKPLPESTPKYEVQFQYSQEELTRDFGTWRTASIYIERRFAGRQIVWANYRKSQRNSFHDQEIIGGTYKPLGRKWAVTAEGMFSPTHKYVGKFSFMGEAERQLGSGFIAHFGGRYTAYTSAKATSIYALGEKYWGNNRAAYTLYVNSLSNAPTALSHRIQYNRYFGEELNSIGASVTLGREHENLGPQIGILRNNIWSVSVSGRYWMTKRLGLNVDGLIHRQGDLYYRRGVNLGLRLRF